MLSSTFLNRLISVIGIILLLATSNISIAQQDQTSHSWSNVSLGVGRVYAGFLGLSYEAGYKNVSGYLSFGYAWSRKADSIVIEDSFNPAAGIRYTLPFGPDGVFPRVGAQFGWVANYYVPEIGDAAYEQSVYGLSFLAGVSFYTPDGVVVSIDAFVSSNSLILNSNQHPHFFNLYVRPSFGIGYDLTGLIGSGNKSNKKGRNRTLEFGG